MKQNRDEHHDDPFDEEREVMRATERQKDRDGKECNFDLDGNAKEFHRVGSGAECEPGPKPQGQSG